MKCSANEKSGREAALFRLFATTALRIRQHASARAAIERVAPQRLDGENARRQRNVRRRTLAGGDPGALIAVLRAAGIEPAAVRELVGFRLGHFVTADDRDAGVRAQAVEVRAAACACVGDV